MPPHRRALRIAVNAEDRRGVTRLLGSGLPVGDVPRTLAVCELLLHDRDDMVVKALSWALRELIPWDAQAVEAFLAEHESVLAGRVKREVRNKLRTGLKNPRQK